MVVILLGIFLPFLTVAFAGRALQCVRRDTAGKSFGAINGNQDTLLCSGTAYKRDATFFWFAYKLL